METITEEDEKEKLKSKGIMTVASTVTKTKTKPKQLSHSDFVKFIITRRLYRESQKHLPQLRDYAIERLADDFRRAEEEVRVQERQILSCMNRFTDDCYLISLFSVLFFIMFLSFYI